jgi:hypothetical protein
MHVCTGMYLCILNVCRRTDVCSTTNNVLTYSLPNESGCFLAIKKLTLTVEIILTKKNLIINIEKSESPNTI